MKPAFRVTIGIVVLTVIAAVLLSTPSSIIVPAIALVDTEYQQSSGKETTVRTKLDFARCDTLQSLPEQFGDWTVSAFCDWSGMEEYLDADVVFGRTYRHLHSSDTFFFVVVQSNDVSSFHPPTICYPSLGYDIVEEGVTEFAVTDSSWAEQSRSTNSRGTSKVVNLGMLQTAEEGLGYFDERISAKKLVVTKDMEKETAQRRVVFYYYVRDERASVPRAVTMIRFSALTSLAGSYEHTLHLAQQLAADTFPLMFELQPKEKMLGEWLITKGGIVGWIVILCSVLAPVLFIFYPSLRRLLRRRLSPQIACASQITKTS